MVGTMCTKFSLVTPFPYLPEHPLFKQLTAKFLAILDSVLLDVDHIRQAPIGVVGEGWGR